MLSIRLSPDGLSFWTTDVIPWVGGDTEFRRDFWSASTEKHMWFDPAKTMEDNLSECIQAIGNSVAGGWKSAEVYPDTLRTMVVPAEYGAAEAVPELLRINGITLDGNDEVFCADISPSIKAIMVYDRTAFNILRGLLGEVEVACPFSLNNANIEKYGIGRRRTTAVYITPEHAYITVFEKKYGSWLYVDVMKWTETTDILYYLSVLDQEFGLRKGKVYLRGAETDRACSFLRKYFRKTRCE